MKLDPRIMKRPFTPWDRKEFLQFIRSHDGKMTIPGYFANSFQAFCDLSNFADFDSAIGVLSAVMDIEYPFSPGKDKWYQFFLPDEWIKEPEKKYRAFTNEEFLNLFDSEKLHSIRRKNEKGRYIITDVYFNDELEKGTIFVKLNSGGIGLAMRHLVNNGYEYFDGKDWKPFGEEE